MRFVFDQLDLLHHTRIAKLEPGLSLIPLLFQC